ncbi:MAG TPA: pyridoxamine 5'-phosphate oxidase family protein [Propioniciclava tarda]|nr:pyridoxamine 5'-phosphate oxidase family protein [Propioniciclava tarda]HQA31562.1 pyridoxamine 5'-phosphate oxidase family protein [Propioniciclava tarda]HQD61270.1 pyridoxamine 5'-phosphate oxidase family protein [Propioniciclava tarda]
MTGHLLPIDTQECRHLLRDATVGRLTWQAPEGLTSLPVAYGVHVDGRLGLQVGASGVLATLAQPTEVAFEVDDLDPVTLTGWSVLVRGTVQAWQGEFPAGLCRPWAPGEEYVALEITPRQLSGRSVSAD